LPDVDLNLFEARDKGVSRRHCALVQYQGVLHVVDLGSVNGTFVNGTRLTAETPYPINPGDELRLGTLDLILLKHKD
jgi:pSer/pThr/pTyr-binding forkhead associated (FHA) protein